ncbi:DUF5990 family protein [Streptomyces sp. NPDC055055]
MSEPSRPLSLRIVGRELPGSTCGPYRDVHVAVQRGREPEGLVPGDATEAVWEFTVTVVPAATAVTSAAGPDDPPDFRGPHVHGPRGARFLYLTWGERPPGGTFTMFRRAKLPLADLPAEAVAAGFAQAVIGLTDAHGLPRCATLRPPAISWDPPSQGRRTAGGGPPADTGTAAPGGLPE